MNVASQEIKIQAHYFVFQSRKEHTFKWQFLAKNKIIVIIMIALPKSIFYKWQNLIGAGKVREHQPILSTDTSRELVINLSPLGLLPTAFIQLLIL